jgi:uncharacterized repeat protein (TIGR03899 family)
MSDEQKSKPLLQVEVLANLTQPLTKLVETISASIGRGADGISRIANVYLLHKQDSKNEARRILLTEGAKTQALTDRAKAIQELTSGQPHQLSSLDIAGSEITSAHLTALPTLSARATQRVAYQNDLQQENLESVLLNTAEELAQEDHVATEPVDQGWTTRFVNITQDISTEELQLLWGKILAGEIKAPGSFSLRTLDVLRNLSQHEASIFNKLANLVVEIHSVSTDLKSRFIYKSDYLSSHIEYADIMLMFDCGLLQPLETAAYNTTIASGPQLFAFRVGNQVLRIQGECMSSFLQLENYTLTTAGVELARLTSATTPLDYLRELASVFQDIGLSASYTKFEGWAEGRILFSPQTTDL